MATYYRFQAVLTHVVGATLILLPASVAEFPEPYYTGETLCRRLAGAEAGVLLATLNVCLAGAANRGRLGASTFRKLNSVAALVNVLVCVQFDCIWPGVSLSFSESVSQVSVSESV